MTIIDTKKDTNVVKPIRNTIPDPQYRFIGYTSMWNGVKRPPKRLVDGMEPTPSLRWPQGHVEHHPLVSRLSQLMPHKQERRPHKRGRIWPVADSTRIKIPVDKNH